MTLFLFGMFRIFLILNSIYWTRNGGNHSTILEVSDLLYFFQSI